MSIKLRLRRTSAPHKSGRVCHYWQGGFHLSISLRFTRYLSVRGMWNHDHRPLAERRSFAGADNRGFGGGARFVAVGVLRLVCPRRVAISASEVAVIPPCIRERNREQVASGQPAICELSGWCGSLCVHRCIGVLCRRVPELGVHSGITRQLCFSLAKNQSNLVGVPTPR